MSGVPAAPSSPARRLGLLLLVLPLLAGGSARSDTQVHVDAGRVTIHAVSTPLANILSRFIQVTGAEIVYENVGPPQQVVSVGIDTDSEADALMRLLEGQGLNYVLRLDPTGREVEMLVVVGKTGTAGPAAAGGSVATRRERATRPEPEPDEDVIQTFTPEPVVEEQPAERAVVSPPAPPSLPSPSPSDRGGIPMWNPSQPQAPVPVSNPGTMRPPTPPSVPAPSAPAPASYPRE